MLGRANVNIKWQRCLRLFRFPPGHKFRDVHSRLFVQVCARIVQHRATTEGGICSACVLRCISQIRQPMWPRSLTISSLFTPWDRVALLVGCVRVWNWAERAFQLALIKRSLTPVGRVRHPDHRRITGTHVCTRAVFYIGPIRFDSITWCKLSLKIKFNKRESYSSFF